MKTTDDIIAALRKMYLVMLSPAAAGIFVLELLRGTGVLGGWHLPVAASIELLLFIFTASTALAVPMLYRAIFASSHRGKMSIAPATLYRYENNSLVLAMMTPWMSLVASVFAFSTFYTIAIFFLSLYACYFHYPSRRKIETDMRIFRVKM